jgi:flagellar basal body-associated protein FliL
MNPHGDRKPEPVDPEHLLRMLDLEMIQQRAIWKQASGRRKSLRAISFLFLFVVILGALLAAYFAFSSGWMDDRRSRNQPESSPAPAANRP